MTILVKFKHTAIQTQNSSVPIQTYPNHSKFDVKPNSNKATTINSYPQAAQAYKNLRVQSAVHKCIGLQPFLPPKLVLNIL